MNRWWPIWRGSLKSAGIVKRSASNGRSASLSGTVERRRSLWYPQLYYYTSWYWPH